MIHDNNKTDLDALFKETEKHLKTADSKLLFRHKLIGKLPATKKHPFSKYRALISTVALLSGLLIVSLAGVNVAEYAGKLSSLLCIYIQEYTDIITATLCITVAFFYRKELFQA